MLITKIMSIFDFFSGFHAVKIKNTKTGAIELVADAIMDPFEKAVQQFLYWLLLRLVLPLW